MADTLSLLRIAKELQVPESTLRYYARTFTEFLPTVDHGRKRRYKPEALEIFEDISNGFKRSESVTNIKSALGSKYKHIVDVDVRQNPSIVNSPRTQSTDMSGNSIDLARLFVTEIRTLYESRINEKNSELKSLQEEFKALEKENLELEKIKALALIRKDMEIGRREDQLAKLSREIRDLKARGWWQRLFKSN